jgi:hypothetical protein
MRALVAGVFTLALASTILAGDGLVLVPHTHAPGTPQGHPHGLALYRFPIALLGEPADAPRPASDLSAAPSFRMASVTGETLAGASLVLVAGLIALAVATVLLGIARVASAAGVLAEQWSASAPTGPPRLLSIV